MMLHKHISDIIYMCTVSALFDIIVPFFCPPPPQWKYVPPPLQQVKYTKWIPASKISLFRNVFKLMDVSSAIIPRDEPFHSPASFNMISKAGIHFSYISCC